MLKSILITGLGLSLIGCTKSPDMSRVPSSVNAHQPATILGEIWGENEMANMDRVGEIFRETLIASTGDAPLMKRDAHPKHHGCVQTHLRIDNSALPSELRVGLFKENKSYNGVIRYSNGDPNFRKADGERDVRGMAVKLFDVPYKSYLEDVGVDIESHTHDFVFMNADAFFIPNPKQYERFMEATKGSLGLLSYMVTHWGTFRNILKARVQIANSLDTDYASATPYLLGNVSTKMKFKSCRQFKDDMPKAPTHDFLGERLESTLKNEEGCFDFYVQPNRDPKKNNIENALIKWDEATSPMIKVGRLTVPKQSGFRSKEAMQACEHLTFNPWRAPKENRPLGGVNRIRLEVYLNQSRLRHEHNQK